MAKRKVKFPDDKDEKLETYGGVCQQIATWINHDWNENANTKPDVALINLTPDDILGMDKYFPALMVHTLHNHMSNKQNAVDVFICDEYCAKKLWLWLHRSEKK